MSLKSTKSKRKGTPRAMPVEAIVTRYKSAQQKKQFEEKKETRTTRHKIERKKKIVIKPQQNIRKEINGAEYYPDKLKRKACNKKIVLKPKHSYTIIGDKRTINKRKLHIPQKGYSKDRTVSPSIPERKTTIQTELSMFEMIKLIEDNGSLDEEDFLEILTCPSPVWWEDPPDDWNFTEEPICNEHSINNKISNKVDCNMNSTSKINNKSTEETITCIKEISTVKFSDNFKNKRRKLETLLSNIKNKTRTETYLQCDLDALNNDISNREKRNSESTDGDSLGIDDEILRDLENMEIPIASGKTKNGENKDILTNKQSSIECEVLVNDKNNEKAKKISPTQASDILKSNTRKRKRAKKVKDLGKTITFRDSEPILVDPLEIPEDKTGTDKIQETHQQTDDSEFITLYKIVNDDDMLNDDKNKMNSYYKQCKNLRKQKTKDDLQKSEDKDSILISDSSDVKYCMKCSSIFDTGHCKYCVKRNEYSKRVNDIKTEYLNIINNIC